MKYEDLMAGTVLQHFELVQDVPISHLPPHYDVQAGVYKDLDGYEQFGFVVVDNRHSSSLKVCEHFSARFCALDDREWFLQVIVPMFARTMSNTHYNTTRDIATKYNEFLDLLKP